MAGLTSHKQWAIENTLFCILEILTILLNLKITSMAIAIV